MRNFLVKGMEVKSVRIVPGASAPEQYAGMELAKYLEKIGIPTGDGITFTLTIDESLVRDAYQIDVCETNGITIRGGNGRGVIYGAYAFLERYAGVRFFTPDLETLGEGDIVVDEGFAHTPVFEYRQSDWQCGNDIDWSVKQGITNRDIPEEKGGNFKYSLFCHSMEHLTGVKQFEGQPCLTDPEMLKRAISGVRTILKENPGAKLISVSQNDNCKFCTCEKCAAIDAEEGSHAGTLIRFVNAVAEDIAKDYPDVVIDTFAYQYTRKAPKITKPLPNVCVRLCSIECCFSHPLEDRTCPENSAFYDDMIAWSKICDRIYIWDYVANYAYYIPPFPNFGVLRENMRFFAEHGVRGMYPEGNYNSQLTGEFGELRCYLLAKLMMDPMMSTTEYYRHMDEFLAAYYGQGWRYIRAFIDYTTMEAKNVHMRLNLAPFVIIPKESYEAMEATIDSWWDKAEAMAGDRLEYVKRSRLQWQYIKLMLHPGKEEGRAFLDELTAKNIRWCEWRDIPRESDLNTAPDQWKW